MADNTSSIMKFKKAGNMIVGTVETTDMLDSITVEDFGAEVVKVVERFPGVHLLLNFEKVNFLSSAALSELIRIHTLADKSLGIVRLCGVSQDIHKVLKITKLDTLFNFNPDDDLSSAIEKMRRSADRAGEEKAWRDQEKARRG